MILNTGARTDTVQYFSKWLLNRFAEGCVYTRNPLFPNKVTRYALSPDKIDAVMFRSKNYAPILPRLHEITDRYRTYFHYTITAYGKNIEPGVPTIDESIDRKFDFKPRFLQPSTFHTAPQGCPPLRNSCAYRPRRRSPLKRYH